MNCPVRIYIEEHGYWQGYDGPGAYYIVITTGSTEDAAYSNMTGSSASYTNHFGIYGEGGENLVAISGLPYNQTYIAVAVCRPGASFSDGDIVTAGPLDNQSLTRVTCTIETNDPFTIATNGAIQECFGCQSNNGRLNPYWLRYNLSAPADYIDHEDDSHDCSRVGAAIVNTGLVIRTGTTSETFIRGDAAYATVPFGYIYFETGSSWVQGQIGLWDGTYEDTGTTPTTGYRLAVQNGAAISVHNNNYTTHNIYGLSICGINDGGTASRSLGSYILAEQVPAEGSITGGFTMDDYVDDQVEIMFTCDTSAVNVSVTLYDSNGYTYSFHMHVGSGYNSDTATLPRNATITAVIIELD